MVSNTLHLVHIFLKAMARLNIQFKQYKFATNQEITDSKLALSQRVYKEE